MRNPVTASELQACLSISQNVMLTIPESEWGRQPLNSDWDRHRILRHVTWAILGYASLLAVEEKRAPIDFLLLDHREDPVEYAVNRLEIATKLLIAVTNGMPPTARAWHPHGAGDAEGFLAMACSEMTMHTQDMVHDLDIEYRAPEDAADRIVRRLYPWSPTDTLRWETLKWATGRATLDGVESAGSDWWAFLAPLDQWDGKVWKRPSGYELPKTAHKPIFQQ